MSACHLKALIGRYAFKWSLSLWDHQVLCVANWCSGIITVLPGVKLSPGRYA